MASQKVFVVQELIGDWEDPEIASLVGCYPTLSAADSAIAEHAKSLSEKVKSEICGYETAFMNLIDEGFQEVYCSIYTSMDEALSPIDSVQGGDA